MNENLPQKYRENFFIKIKKFILSLFNVNNEEDKLLEVKEINKKEESNSLEQLKKETKKIIDQDNLLKQIEENPSVIINWPIEKLERLEQICDEKILQYRREITEIKSKSA